MIISDSMERARGYLQGAQSDIVNRVAETYSPGDEDLVLQYEPEGVGRGSVVSAGRNCFTVWQVDAPAKTLSVSGGWQGATDVMIPAGTIVRIKPRYLDHMLFDAVCDSITELSSPEFGLFAVGQVELPYLAHISVYDLIDAVDLEDILSVSLVNPNDPTDRWPVLGASEWELRRIAPTPEFPSGLQLRLNYVRQDYSATIILITYKKAFSVPADIDVDIEDVGLPDTAYDLPALGAAHRLAYSQESKRTSTHAQGDARRAQEVPAGSSLGAARAITALYRQRVNQEYARLLRQYGIRNR